MVIEEEPSDVLFEIGHSKQMKIDEEEADAETKENEDEDDPKEDNEESSSKPKLKKKMVYYPDEITKDERYKLFLKLYRERGSVDVIVAEAVKELKV